MRTRDPKSQATINRVLDSAEKGKIAPVLEFVAGGGSPDAFSESAGCHLITAAASEGRVEMIRALVKAGANPNVRGTWVSMPPHGTPLETACVEGQLESVKALVELGADLHMKGEVTPIEAAVRCVQLPIVKYLVSRGVVLAESKMTGAVSRDRLEILKFLVSKGATLSTPNERGSYPIHYAASSRHSEVVEYVASCGVDLNSKDSQGLTPLHKAVSREYEKTAAALLRLGADTTSRDNLGRTPAMIAAETRNPELIKLFKDLPGSKAPAPSRQAKLRSEDAKYSVPRHQLAEPAKESSGRSLLPFKEAVAKLAIPELRKRLEGVVSLLVKWGVVLGKVQKGVLHVCADDRFRKILGGGVLEFDSNKEGWVIAGFEAPIAKVALLLEKHEEVGEYTVGHGVVKSRKEACNPDDSEGRPAFLIQFAGSDWSLMILQSHGFDEGDGQLALDLAKAVSFRGKIRSFCAMSHDAGGGEVTVFEKGKVAGKMTTDRADGAFNAFFFAERIYLPDVAIAEGPDGLPELQVESPTSVQRCDFLRLVSR